MSNQVIAPTTEIVTSRPCETKFGKLALKCVSCSATEAGDGFILTLKHESFKEMKTPFGVKKQPIRHTFYMKVSDECPVDTEADMNMDDFNIIERVFETKDETTGEVITMWLKWLHLK
jgi:hypothetical protein